MSTINYIDLSSTFTSNNSGVFTGGVQTNIGCDNKHGTNSSANLLDGENIGMDNNKFIEELRSLLFSRFNNDIVEFAKCVGKPVDDIRAIMEGSLDVPAGFIEDLTDCIANKSGHVQFGDKYIEINNSGENYTNNYAGILKGAQINLLKQQKEEILELKRAIKDKDEIIKSKDDLISILKEQLNKNRTN